jgi:hypothetical protein
MKMTHTQQTKLAEMLVSKLNAAQNKPFVEIIPQSEIQAEIQAKMVLAGVVGNMLQDAYISGSKRGFVRGSNAALKIPNKTNAIQDFDNYLNNMK